MSNMSPAFTEIGVVVLTSGFQIRGNLHVLGVMQTFLNDDQKPTLSIFGADALGIDPGNPAAHLTQPEIVVNKRAAQIIALTAAPPPGAITLLAKIENLVLYTDVFAIAGKFHMGPDAHLADFAESSLQQFIVASEVKIYPLFQPRPGFHSAAPIVLIHKSAIRMYHHT